MVSIIIPIYNPGEALRRCLDSAAGQTYRDIEILLVNDGSTDSSASICREYAARDSRFVYIEQPNAGVSAARNRGLAAARGEYLAFIDSDDYAEPDYIGCMVEALARSAADIAIQGTVSKREGGQANSSAYEKAIYREGRMPDDVFDKIFYSPSPYCKLFKSSIVSGSNITFPIEVSYGEDAVFFYKYLKYIKTIETLPDENYVYIVGNNNSLTTKLLSPEKFWLNQQNCRSAYRELKQKYCHTDSVSPAELQCKIIGLNGMLYSILKFTNDDEEISNYINQIISDESFRFVDIDPSNFKQKLIFSLVKRNSRMSRRVLKALFLHR